MTPRLSPPPAPLVVPGHCSAAGTHRGLCGQKASLYPCGWRCDTHAPWALAGRPRPEPGPGWPEGAHTTPTPQAASGLFDARAVASGKRRSHPHEYRAAQAAVTTKE